MPTVLALRDGLDGLAQIAQNELKTALGVTIDPSVVRQAVADLAPGLVVRYGSAAAAYAADWYDDLRAELEVRGTFAAIPAEVEPVGADALAGYGTTPLYGASPDLSAAQALLLGGLQRRIANVARDTIMQSSIADPQAEGWQRVGRGGCDFCLMLIGRGAVYTEQTAAFASHDHCHCTSVPAFTGQPSLVQPRSTASVDDVARARVNRYLRSH